MKISANQAVRQYICAELQRVVGQSGTVNAGTCNAIAKQFSVASSVVEQIAQEEGLSQRLVAAAAYHNRKLLSQGPKSFSQQAVLASVTDTSGDLAKRIAHRSQETISSSEFRAFREQVLAPLGGIIQHGNSQPTHWNAKIWRTFQLYDRMIREPDAIHVVAPELAQAKTPTSRLLDAVRQTFMRAALVARRDKRGGANPTDTLAYRDALETLKDDTAAMTVARLIQAHQFARRVFDEERQTLRPSEWARYAEAVHDVGYMAEQRQRMLTRAQRGGSTETLQVPVGSGGTLVTATNGAQSTTSEAFLALLTPAARARYEHSHDSQVVATAAAFPKLTLKDFFGDDANGGKIPEATAAARAIQFFSWVGKDVEAPNVDLGGQSLRQFLVRQPEESEPQFFERLSGKQFFNAFMQPWSALCDDAQARGVTSRNPEHEAKQLEFILHRQEAAVAAALALVKDPAISQKALTKGVDSPELAHEIDFVNHVMWRVCNPSFDFEHPLIAQGYDALGADQKAKDRSIWRAIVAIDKTRQLAGLSDDSFASRFGTASNIKVTDDNISQQLLVERLFRDIGPESQPLTAALAALRIDGSSESRAALHSLRFDPRMYVLDMDSKGHKLRLGAMEFEAVGVSDGRLAPALVAATTLGFRVKVVTGVSGVAPGTELLLRLPKGAYYAVNQDGTLAISKHNKSRYENARERLSDQEVLARSYSVKTTPRIPVYHAGEQVACLDVLPEKVSLACDALGRNERQLDARGVDFLLDLYLRGTAQVDETGGHKFGAFYELGPDNVAIDATGGLVPYYLDIATVYRTERDRAEFGFVCGNYGAAANWIVADATPLSPERVLAIWHGDGLTKEQHLRRELFLRGVEARLNPRHPIYAGLEAEQRDSVMKGLAMEYRLISAIVGKPSRNS